MKRRAGRKQKAMWSLRALRHIERVALRPDFARLCGTRRRNELAMLASRTGLAVFFLPNRATPPSDEFAAMIFSMEAISRFISNITRGENCRN